MSVQETAQRVRFSPFSKHFFYCTLGCRHSSSCFPFRKNARRRFSQETVARTRSFSSRRERNAARCTPRRSPQGDSDANREPQLTDCARIVPFRRRWRRSLPSAIGNRFPLGQHRFVGHSQGGRQQRHRIRFGYVRSRSSAAWRGLDHWSVEFSHTTGLVAFDWGYICG